MPVPPRSGRTGPGGFAILKQIDQSARQGSRCYRFIALMFRITQHMTFYRRNSPRNGLHPSHKSRFSRVCPVAGSADVSLLCSRQLLAGLAKEFRAGLYPRGRGFVRGRGSVSLLQDSCFPDTESRAFPYWMCGWMARWDILGLDPNEAVPSQPPQVDRGPATATRLEAPAFNPQFFSEPVSIASMSTPKKVSGRTVVSHCVVSPAQMLKTRSTHKKAPTVSGKP